MIIVSNVRTANDIYSMHTHCSLLEINQISRQIEQIDDDLLVRFKETAKNVDWPASENLDFLTS